MNNSLEYQVKELRLAVLELVKVIKDSLPKVTSGYWDTEEGKTIVPSITTTSSSKDKEYTVIRFVTHAIGNHPKAGNIIAVCGEKSKTDLYVVSTNPGKDAVNCSACLGKLIELGEITIVHVMNITERDVAVCGAAGEGIKMLAPTHSEFYAVNCEYCLKENYLVKSY